MQNVKYYNFTPKDVSSSLGVSYDASFNLLFFATLCAVSNIFSMKFPYPLVGSRAEDVGDGADELSVLNNR